jgi:hypothetical protein
MRTADAWRVPLLLALALVAAVANATPVEIGLNFTGTTQSESNFVPPDTDGAVGQQDIVELLNGRFAVYRKSDGALLKGTSQDDFWRAAGVQPDFPSGDPRVLYDASSGRWFASATDFNGDPPTVSNSYLVAVSKTSDPTQGWTAFKITTDPTGTAWTDFPTLGFDSKGVYISSDVVPNGSQSSVLGHTILVIPKDDLLASTPTVAHSTLLPRVSTNVTGFTPQPVVNLDNSIGAETLISGSVAVLGQLQLSTINGPINTPTVGNRRLIAVPFINSQPPAVQPGGPTIETGLDSRFGASVVELKGSLWAVQSADMNGRAAIRWYQIDPVAKTLLQAGYIADPSLDLYYPSIAVNGLGRVVIGMSGSSSTKYASAYAVAGETVNGTTTFGGLIPIAAGSGSYDQVFAGRNRWGDYSTTVVDPSDPNSFWTFQEFALGGNEWGVHIADLVFVPEPSTSILLSIGLAMLTRFVSRTSMVARRSRPISS